MNEKELRNKIENYINNLQIQDLEEKIAPVDCTKKPDHPDCQPQVRYGGPQPQPLYGVKP